MRISNRGRAASTFRYSPLVAALACVLAPHAASGAVYPVTSTADFGPGTLRQALADANSTCDSAATIVFPNAGPFVVQPSSPLPSLVNCPGGPVSVTIDGSSHPDFAPNTSSLGFTSVTPVVIDGEFSYGGCHFSTNDFGYGEGTLAIKGLTIQNLSGTAICGAVKITGSRVLGNLGHGIDAGDSSVIGGLAIADRNVISGNDGSGIQVFRDNVQVVNNLIGTDDSGNAARPNVLSGIESICTLGFSIQGNVISGNGGSGIQLDGNGVDIGGNKIGLGADGSSAVANGQHGIHIGLFECGADGMRIDNNFIAHNFGYGVLMTDGTGHTIDGSSIHSNGDKNISIDFAGGPLPNDPGDIDGGVNNRQNHPVITLVTQNAGTTFVTWTMDSQPTTHTIEFFSNDGPTGPAGKTPLPQLDSTDASGNYTATTAIPGLHDFIAATATNNSTGDTSEFSSVVAVTPTPGAEFSPTQLGFGGVPTGSTSAAQTAKLISTGSAPYVISLIESGGSCYGGPPAPPAMCSDAEFTCSTTCAPGTPYGNGQFCTFTATFSPTFLGFQSTTIHVCDNAVGSPRTLTLSGFGVAPPPLQLSPSSHSFGSVLVGTSSRSQLFRVSNPGTGPQEISGISTTSPEFGITSNNCPAEVPPEASCDVEVAFSPAVAGNVSGALVVQVQNNLVDAAVSSKATLGSSTISAALSGRGVVQAQGVLSMPTSVDVGTYTLGSPALETTVDLSNTGSSPIELTSITITGPFTLVNECEATLAAGASCRLRIGFSATTLGDFQGTLSVVTSATGGSRSIPVTARSQASPLPLVRVSPTAISFGERMAGTLSGAQRIVINNLGGAPASITTMLTGPHFQVTGTNCGPTLAAQTECFADVAFLPSAFGARNAQFIVGSNSAGSPHIVTLNGVGCRPFFPSAQRGTSSGPNCAP